MDLFSKDQVGFWGAISAFFAFAVPAYYRYREKRNNISCPIPGANIYKGNNMSEQESKELLAGREVEVKFDGESGGFFVDADSQGGVEIGLNYNKDVSGFVEVKSSLSAKSNIFNLAQKIAEKTATPFDDKVIQGIKDLLGIK